MHFHGLFQVVVHFFDKKGKRFNWNIFPHCTSNYQQVPRNAYMDTTKNRLVCVYFFLSLIDCVIFCNCLHYYVRNILMNSIQDFLERNVSIFLCLFLWGQCDNCKPVKWVWQECTTADVYLLPLTIHVKLPGTKEDVCMMSHAKCVFCGFWGFDMKSTGVLVVNSYSCFYSFISAKIYPISTS